MSDKKGWGTTVLGWFIQQDGSTAPPSEADAVPPELARAAVTADAPPPPPIDDASLSRARDEYRRSAAEPTPKIFSKELPPAPDGRVDFDAVYDAAGIDADERGRVEKARDLLGSLPAEADAAMKKTIVGASLKAFGVPVEKIIETAVGEIQALEGYIRAGAADTSKLFEESEQRIAKFEEEIRRIRQVMEARVREQQAVSKSCNDKKLEVQQVLEFFGREKVAEVVRDSAKLHEPTAGGAG